MAVGALLFAPLLAGAQPAGGSPRVGFLFYGSPGPSPEIDAFRRGLRDHGYVEGQNITVEYRFAGGRVGQLPQLAAELARLNPEVIVTPGTPASLAAKNATKTIPIVFVGVADAVGAGLVANLARPEGNTTGLASLNAELGGKRLEILKQVAPKASRVAVLYNPADRANVLVLKGLQQSAPALGLTLQPFEVREPRDFEAAFAAMSRKGAQAMFGATGVLTTEHRKTVVALAVKNRIPTMWGDREFVDVGGLMSYAGSFQGQVRDAAAYVDKILKGAKPGDLPVQQSSTFDLVINLKTARAMGFTIPPAVLSQATEVIQ
ncbi:MAG TPA: ABC transporter substrate-binding protein [Verrucomicrobiae bacterium]|jgi:putative ABC transport system substrate-binding protein|nr:ABC transporter substrate-binding protein [Verrucomicrobiae bacterium]